MRRAGFTLLEILIVVAIIGVLICLLLPAIQMCREMARRLQCSSNMSQLGVALKNYESAHGVLPSGVVNADGPIANLPSGYHHNWIVQILPYMELSTVYWKVDFSVGVYEKQNDAARAVPIGLLCCPSSPQMMISTDGTRGYSHYAGCHHDVEAPIDRDNHGMFFLNSGLRSRDVPDGARHTIYVGEKPCDAENLGWMSGTRATLRNTGTPMNLTEIDETAGYLDSYYEENGDYYGGYEDFGEYGEAYEEYDEEPPEPTPEEIEAEEKRRKERIEALASRLSGQTQVGGFGSEHFGVTNFLFGDGAVRPLAVKIDMEVYQQLGHRADGKLLQDRCFE